MIKRSTIIDVARSAGVSIKTVSRVFNKEPYVRQPTRDKVLTAAKQLDYRPNQSARRLASNRAFVIGMLYDNPNPDYITEVQYGALHACRKQDNHLLIHPTRADSSSLIDEIIGLHHQSTVDGFIVLQPVSDFIILSEKLLEAKIPCVRVSQRPFEGFPWISVGDEEAAENMTEHLLKLGHRRIGFIMGHPDHGSSHSRLFGYRGALERHNIEFDETLVQQGFFDYESGYACARKLLELQPRPTAIFASNDHMAMGVQAATHEKGLVIPRQLSIAGFDDTPMARFASPPLTTVRQPIAQIAQLATEVLLRQLNDQSEDDPNYRLNAALVCRKSTAEPEEG